MGGGHHAELTRDDLMKEPERPAIHSFILNCLIGVVDGPVTYFHDHVIPKFRRPAVPYYHRRYPRVPTIDQCTVGDVTCFFEANQQFKRDRAVDGAILNILMERKNECIGWYYQDREDVDKYCTKVFKDFEEASTNYVIKYADLGFYGNARDALMKQKHRMLWERRNGPVGSSKLTDEEVSEITEDNMFTILKNRLVDLRRRKNC